MSAVAYLVRAHAISEKREERLGDRLMTSLGFTVIRFSQPRASKQTPGIPDRKYYRAAPVGYPSYAVWWEAKRENGKQSEPQRRFEAMVRICGEEYVCGTSDALVRWCRQKGLIR